MSSCSRDSAAQIAQLNEEFGISDALSFETHESGLVQALVTTQACRGRVFLLGAHVAEFQPTGQQPVLFMSEQATYEVGKPIRGGIPICFPWFGAKKDTVGEPDPTAPSHGLVRTELWRVKRTWSEGDAVSIELGFTMDRIEISYTVHFGESLEFELESQNVGETLVSCEVALHTYFEIGSVEQVAISGLEELDFLDQLTGQTLAATHDVIRFTEETDRIYHGQVDTIELEDPANSRSIVINPKGSESTVVWNPWIAKSKRMPDFGDNEYPKMCCIETANIGPHAIQLASGETHSTGATLHVRPHTNQ